MSVKMPGVRTSRYGLCPQCCKRGLRYDTRIESIVVKDEESWRRQGFITCRYCGIRENVSSPKDISDAVQRLRDRCRGYLFEFHVYEPGASIPSYAVTRATRRDPLRLASRFIRWVNYVWSRPGGVDCAVSRVKVWRVNIWPEGPAYVGERRRRAA